MQSLSFQTILTFIDTYQFEFLCGLFSGMIGALLMDELGWSAPLLCGGVIVLIQTVFTDDEENDW